MEYKIINAISSKNVPKFGNEKKYIAVHYLGVVGQNHEIAADGCGAHYYIYWDGTIYQRCTHDAIVWAVGTAGYYKQKHAIARNANTISIEMCCKCDGDSSSAEDKKWYFTEETQEACVWLVRMLMDELDIPVENVLRHYDIVNKICPAPYVHNNKYKSSWTWQEFKDKLTVKLCTGTQTSEFAKLSEKQSAERLLEIAKPIAEKYSLFPSVLAAQAILESGYCKTELAKKGNNVCGMKSELLNSTWKSPSWKGENVKILTTEYNNAGKKLQVYADFRKYDSIEDCMEDRCAFFTHAKVSNTAKEIKYAGITSCKDYTEQITLIKNKGYATDPQYIGKVCDIIKRYNLDRYETPKYIVQAGVFFVKINAKKYADQIKKKGIYSIVKKKDKKYVVECGTYTNKKGAENRIKKLKEAGFEAIIK